MPDGAAERGMQARSVSGRLVLVAGATSASGEAATRALVGAGARVVAVGRDRGRLEPLARLGARVETADLTDDASVGDLVDRLHADEAHVDGLLHLVGGWRGGGGIAGQTDADYRFLEQSLTALRLVSRAVWDDLVASSAARVAIVSSTAVARPLAGGANYAAVKAASEAWTRALAHGFAKEARDAGRLLESAAVVFRVKALSGLETALADAYARLWTSEATEINDTVIEL